MLVCRHAKGFHEPVTGPDSVNLLLIEDDPMLARGVASALSKSGYAVAVAATAGDALRMAQTASFNIGILDLGLPDRDGMHLLRELRAAGNVFPILILSARAGLNDRIRGLDTGADDYLVKPFALAELEARLRALLRRQEDDSIWRQLGRLHFDAAGKRALIDDNEVELTSRECAVLDILLRNSGKIVSKQKLFDAVFTFETNAAPNALEVQISRLRQKLRSAGVAIRALRGLGYRIELHDGITP